METNKIIRKHLLPGNIVTCTTILALSTLMICTAKQKPNSTETTIKQKFISVSLDAFIALLCLSLLTLIIFESYKEDYEFASHAARRFLRKTMKEHPEMKTFEKVLSNERAMKSIATMISNHLRPSEQKLVLDTVKGLKKITEDADFTKEERIVAIKQTYDQIIKIVQEHAAVHPDFINEVYAAMAYADTTYVIPAQQKTR